MYTDTICEIASERRGNIHAKHADRRSPTNSDARTNIEIEVRPQKRIAAVDEQGCSPFRKKIALELHARDRQISTSDDVTLGIGAAQLLVSKAAYRAVTAREEAQLWRESIEIMH